jgi:hypothetical protein
MEKIKIKISSIWLLSCKPPSTSFSQCSEEALRSRGESRSADVIGKPVRFGVLMLAFVIPVYL